MAGSEGVCDACSRTVPAASRDAEGMMFSSQPPDHLEISFLRSLVSELLHIDEKSLNSSLRLLTAAHRKQNQLASRPSPITEVRDAGSAESSPTPVRHQSGEISSAKTNTITTTSKAPGIGDAKGRTSDGSSSSSVGGDCRIRGVDSRAVVSSGHIPDDEIIAASSSLDSAIVCNQMTLSVFREICAKSQDAYLQQRSPLPVDGLDFSVWTDHDPLILPAVTVNGSRTPSPGVFPRPLPSLQRQHRVGLPRKDMEVVSSLKWSEYPHLPVDKDSVAGVCHAVQIKDRLVVATTVKCEQLEKVAGGSSSADTDSGSAEASRRNGSSSGGGDSQLYTRRTVYRAALFVTDPSLRRWHPVAAPQVNTSHTVDGLCVERMQSKLLLVVRPCVKSDGPTCVWSIDNEGAEMTLRSTWTPFCVVPAGHRCGTFALIGNFLVAAGGKLGGGDSATQRSVSAYDFSRNDWVHWPSLPVPMYAAAPVVFNENQLVLCGGVQGYGSDRPTDNESDHPEMGRHEALSLSVTGDTPGKEWTMFCYMKTPCLAPSAANIYGMLVAHNGGDPRNSDVSWWDGVNGEWRRVSTLPEACVDSAIIEFYGNLVIIGGEQQVTATHAASSNGKNGVADGQERNFSTKVSAVKIIRRNTDALCSQRKRSVQHLVEA
eukprot:scpid43422/ scgid0772/ 